MGFIHSYGPQILSKPTSRYGIKTQFLIKPLFSVVLLLVLLFLLILLHLPSPFFPPPLFSLLLLSLTNLVFVRNKIGLRQHSKTTGLEMDMRLGINMSCRQTAKKKKKKPVCLG